MTESDRQHENNALDRFVLCQERYRSQFHCSVAHFLKELTGCIPHVYFHWTDINPVTNVMGFIFHGGDTAPHTHEVLRRAIKDPARRPIVHVTRSKIDSKYKRSVIPISMPGNYGLFRLSWVEICLLHRFYVLLASGPALLTKSPVLALSIMYFYASFAEGLELGGRAGAREYAYRVSAEVCRHADEDLAWRTKQTILR